MDFNLIIYGILCIIPSILGLAVPKIIIKLGRSWQYKDLEPTEEAIAITKVISVVAIFVGIVLIVMGIV